MEALEIYEASLCRQCGRPLDVCRDPKAIVVADSEVCMYASAVQVEQRRDEAKHDKEKPNAKERHWSDGRSYLPREASAQEIADARRLRRPSIHTKAEEGS